jgi:hypothetical protein
MVTLKQVFSRYIFIYCFLENGTHKPVLKSLTVKEDLTVELWCNEKPVPKFQYKEMLSKNEICERWSNIFKLLYFLMEIDANRMEIDRDDENLRIVYKLLEEVSTSESMSAENTRTLHFMKEQIKLLKMKQISYSADTLIWATTVYFSFPLMENSKLLKLPHPRHLKTLLMKLDTENSNLSTGHIKDIIKDIVGLFPVTNLKCDFLYRVFLKYVCKF